MLDRFILPKLTFNLLGHDSYFPDYIRWLFKNLEKKYMRILIVNVFIMFNAKKKKKKTKFCYRSLPNTELLTVLLHFESHLATLFGLLNGILCKYKSTLQLTRTQILRKKKSDNGPTL